MRTRRYLSSRHYHVKPDKILESNLVFKLDKFYGITIVYEANLRGKRITLETLYTMASLFTKSNTSAMSSRLQNLEVRIHNVSFVTKFRLIFKLLKTFLKTYEKANQQN